MERLFDCRVYDGLDLSKYRSRRKHLAIFVRAVDPYEFRIQSALCPVDVTDTLLEFYVSFMDVLCSFEILLSGCLALTPRIR